MLFPYKTVLMIGATSGIGRALAERMMENGIFVIGVGRRKDRLEELVVKYGPEKAAASQFDITDLDGIPAWSDHITKTYPNIDCVVLNSGLMRTLNFAKPHAMRMDLVHQEITTNYIAYIHLIKALLPHLQSQAPKPGALVAVSSGLALVPIPRCANYCGVKSALHSLCWTLREQLASDGASRHIRVVEILPPAVQTELHPQQKDLVEIGQGDIGMPLGDFTDEAWAGLVRGDEEIAVGPLREYFDAVEAARREVFRDLSKILPGVPGG